MIVAYANVSASWGRINGFAVQLAAKSRDTENPEREPNRIVACYVLPDCHPVTDGSFRPLQSACRDVAASSVWCSGRPPLWNRQAETPRSNFRAGHLASELGAVGDECEKRHTNRHTVRRLAKVGSAGVVVDIGDDLVHPWQRVHERQVRFCVEEHLSSKDERVF